MRWLFASLLFVLGPATSAASVQPQMYCWSPDLEFPVPCDEDGEDEAGEPEVRPDR